MTKRLNTIFLIVMLFTFISALRAQQRPDGHVSLVQDWSHRHVRYSDSGTLQQRVNLMREPRALHNYLDRAWHPNYRSNRGDIDATFRPGKSKGKNSSVDWAISLGTGGQFPTAETPAKYQFDITKPPDCTNDFVVFPIDATPSSTQANIVAINNLYAGTNPTGQCGTQPTVMWAYKLGTAGTALSPALSIDGKKVAMLETGNPVKLHVLTWQAGQGTTAITPYAGTPVDAVISYTTVAGTGCTNASAQDSNASPYIDYDGDGAFLSANNGILYHIKGVFNGTPTMDFCFPVGGTTAVMSSPVYDSSAKKVFISDGASVYSVDFSPTAGFSNKKSVTVASANGITLSPIIDGSSQMVYVFSKSDTANQHSIVSQIPYTMATHHDVPIGAVASGYILDGAFDNNFYSSTDTSTWTLYACGTAAANGAVPALYGIGFLADGTLNSTPLFTNTTINPGGANGACSPLQEFYDGTTDRMFISTTGSSTVSMYNITNRLTATSTATATAPNYSGGTGSFAVDNTSTNPQAASIYFGTMGTSTTSCPIVSTPTSVTVQHAAGSSASKSNSLSFPIPTTSLGDMIVVVAGANDNTITLSGVSDSAGDSFTHASNARFTSSGSFVDVYYALKTTKAGATTVNISYSKNVTKSDAEVWVVSGYMSPVLDVVNGVNNGVQSGGTSTGASVTTTSAFDEFVAAFVNTSGVVSANPKSGNEFTSGGDKTGNGDAGASLVSDTAGAHQPAWSDNGTSFSSVTIAFKEGVTTTANYCAVKLTQSGLK